MKLELVVVGFKDKDKASAALKAVEQGESQWKVGLAMQPRSGDMPTGK